MIKNCITLIFIFFYFTGFSQTIINKNLNSDFLKTERNLKIYLPEGYEIDSIKNYPLTVVLDSEYLLDAYIGNAVLFAAKDKAPKQIIVGIPMEKTKEKDTYYTIETGRLTKDNYAFYQFIKEEVIFYMESTYRTSPFITLVAEGTSANLITHYLGENKPHINSYICINPNFSNFIAPQFASYNFSKFLKEDTAFYFYTNNSNSFSEQKQNIIRELQKGLASLEMQNFTVINDTITTASSVAAISEAIPRALTKVFQIYSSISDEEFTKNIKEKEPQEVIDYLENKYVEIEYLFGSSLGIRERDIFAVEKIIIEKENGKYLRNFGKMILKIHPNSPLGDYYIGRFYEQSKNIKKALTHYKIGYGKMDPANPNADAFYENILRLNGE